MKTRNITVIGLGRTGASVGLALKRAAMDVTIVGHDPDRERMRAAQERRALDAVQPSLSRAAADADILIIALPADQVENTLAAIGDQLQEHTLVLDFSPLKAAGQEWARTHLRQGHFVGAAPVLAASALEDARRGPEAARADLFQNSLICLAPSPKADPKAVETAVTLGGLLGAKPFFLDAAEYDSLVKGVETLPGLVAAAVFRAITRSAGWRDMLRFASLPFAVSTSALQDESEIAALALQDREATLRWLDAVTSELEEIRSWIAGQDVERLSAYLTQLQAEREKWLAERAKNDWEEHITADITPLSFRERMLGFRGGQDR
jgi:prephenate dehydrogenase